MLDPSFTLRTVGSSSQFIFQTFPLFNLFRFSNFSSLQSRFSNLSASRFLTFSLSRSPPPPPSLACLPLYLFLSLSLSLTPSLSAPSPFCLSLSPSLSICPPSFYLSIVLAATVSQPVSPPPIYSCLVSPLIYGAALTFKCPTSGCVPYYTATDFMLKLPSTIQRNLKFPHSDGRRKACLMAPFSFCSMGFLKNT